MPTWTSSAPRWSQVRCAPRPPSRSAHAHPPAAGGGAAAGHACALALIPSLLLGAQVAVGVWHPGVGSEPRCSLRPFRLPCARACAVCRRGPRARVPALAPLPAQRGVPQGGAAAGGGARFALALRRATPPARRSHTHMRGKGRHPNQGASPIRERAASRHQFLAPTPSSRPQPDPPAGGGRERGAQARRHARVQGRAPHVLQGRGARRRAHVQVHPPPLTPAPSPLPPPRAEAAASVRAGRTPRIALPPRCGGWLHPAPRGLGGGAAGRRRLRERLPTRRVASRVLAAGAWRRTWATPTLATPAAWRWCASSRAGKSFCRPLRLPSACRNVCRGCARPLL